MLALLAEPFTLAVSDVADGLDLNLSAASTVVEQLVRLGWAEKERVADDRRVSAVRRTRAGQDMVRDTMQRRREVLETLMAAMDPANVAQLRQNLGKVEAGRETRKESHSVGSRHRAGHQSDNR